MKLTEKQKEKVCEELVDCKYDDMSKSDIIHEGYKGLDEMTDIELVEELKLYCYNDDGSVRIIVSNEDPGLPNWIQCCDHTEGTMCWRWYRLLNGVDPVEPECRVVQLEEINN